MSTCHLHFSHLFKLRWKLEKQNSQSPKSHCFCWYFSSSVGQKQKTRQSLSEAFGIQGQNTVGLPVSYGQVKERVFMPLLSFMSQREAGEGPELISQLTLDFSNTQVSRRLWGLTWINMKSCLWWGTSRIQMISASYFQLALTTVPFAVSLCSNPLTLLIFGFKTQRSQVIYNSMILRTSLDANVKAKAVILLENLI